MDELIKRSEALKALGERPLSWTDSDSELAEARRWEYDYHAIKAVPAVDAVPVVRCKDCKHWEAHFGKHYCMADPSRIIVRKADFYCFDGKRKDGKEE